MKRAMWFIPILLAGLSAPACSSVPESQLESSVRVSSTEGHLLPVAIGVARASLPGIRVTIEGVVSTPSGAFQSSFGDVGFAVQDATGGIYVSLPFDLGLRVGQRVRVVGTRGDSQGLAILVPDHPNDVVVLKGREDVPVRAQTTASLGEATEGWIVRLTGRLVGPVTSDLPYGYKLTLNDGSGPAVVFINLETGIDAMALVPGETYRMAGFASQYADHYEIDPRYPRDIQKTSSSHQ